MNTTEQHRAEQLITEKLGTEKLSTEKLSTEKLSTEQIPKPLDMNKLNDAFMDNLDIIKQILSTFKESFASFESEFRSAVKVGDTELMSRLAHGLKGSAGNIRAESLSAKAADLQHKVDEGKGFDIEMREVVSGLHSLYMQIDDITS